MQEQLRTQYNNPRVVKNVKKSGTGDVGSRIIEVGRLHPTRMSLDIKANSPHTAKITVPNDDYPTSVNTLIKIAAPNGYEGLFYVKSKETDYTTDRSRLLNCEHVYGITKNAYVVGKVTGKQISGTSTNSATVVQVMDYLLSKVKFENGYIVGMSFYSDDCPYATDKNQWQFNNQSVYECIESVLEYYPDSELKFDYTMMESYGYLIVRLVAKQTNISCELRSARNMKSIKVQYDASDMYNVIHPIGSKNKNIKTVSTYTKQIAGHTFTHTSGQTSITDESSVALYGVIESVESQTNISEVNMLSNWGIACLYRFSSPKISITCDAEELSSVTGVSIDKLDVGKACRIPLPDYGITYTDRIVSMSWSDMIENPKSVTVTIGNEKRSIQRVLKQKNKAILRGIQSAIDAAVGT